jgi:Spy/CpxP family protein refolding chaperone
MHRKTLLASALAVLMAGSTALVIAQDAPPPPEAAHSMADHGMPGHHDDRHDRGMRDHGMRDRGLGDEHGGVIGDLRGLERLYMMSGRSKDMAAVYNEVLAKSQDPRVRDYAYQHLARLQAQPANVDQAIATMRKGLDESLAQEAKMRVERESMHDARKQHPDNAAKPSAGE